MAPVYGSLSEFKSEEEDWKNYVERIECYFTANEINDAAKKKNILLSVVGAKTYSLIRSLADNDVSAESYAGLITLMSNHLHPVKNEIAERFVFNRRDRKDGESIRQFVSVLRKLAEDCNYGGTLQEQLRDRIVCGVRDERMQQKLLSETGLDLPKTIKICTAIEAAGLYIKEMQASSSSHVTQEGGSLGGIHKIGTEQKAGPGAGKRECYRCGNPKHMADVCPFKDKECFNCRKIGHTRRKCKGGEQRKELKQLVVKEEELEGAAAMNYDMSFLDLYPLKTDNSDAVILDLKLNGVDCGMEIDTGAALSVISTEKYKLIKKSGEKLVSTNTCLKTYTGEIVKPVGVAKVVVEYHKQKYNLDVAVICGNTPSLIGRDWLNRGFQVDWNNLFSVSPVKTLEKREIDIDIRIKELKDRYSKVFSSELGCLKDFKVHIPVSKDVEPKFCKARPVPYTLRSKVELELDRLENQGVWRRVTYSKWAAPIVVVPKDNGAIRICGDFKQTINKVAPLDTYPIPCTEDQLATLAGGEKFSKLDLSQAYQQLLLDDETQELLTINTHKGLYQPTRLQYGVHSVTGIFQREMDKRLTGIPLVKVRVDDILISGHNDEEHLSNLERVFIALHEAGLTVKSSKCKFMAPEVNYCGFRINKEGVKPLEENVNAVKNAPPPTNITELRSFLGMVNYYNQYIPRLSTITEPLHMLLRKGVIWKWEKAQRVAFEKIKELLCSAPLLTHFDPSKPIIVHCDASLYGVGVVLSHLMSNGEEHPVCFGSRTLSKAERGYGHIEKEGLSLIYAVKKFHQYLYGQSFMMVTDHKPLLGLFSENKGLPDRAAGRILRWALLLAAYDYKLEYRRGCNHANADGLSRLPLESVDYTRKELSMNMLEMVNAPVTEKEVAMYTRRDPLLSRVYDQVLNGWSDIKDASLEHFSSRKYELTVKGGCVLWGYRVVIPEKLRDRMLMQLHDGHGGMSKLKAIARSFFWWPGLDKQVENMVRNCSQCIRSQSSPKSAPMHVWEFPSGPWERIHIDFAGPFLGKMFLLVVDAYSKWLEVEVMPIHITSSFTITKLRKIFATHGLPEVLVSDNGPSFVSSEFEEFLKKNGVRHITSAPYHPASNGQVERMVRIFKEAMKTLETGDIECKVSRFLLRYRTTPHGTTGSSPAELLFKRQLRTALHRLRPDLTMSVKGKQNQMEGSKPIKSHTRVFEEGDSVFVRNFGMGEKWIAGRIHKRIGAVNYEILVGNRILHRHVDQLLKGMKTDIEVNIPDDEEAVLPEIVNIPEQAEGNDTPEVFVQPEKSMDTTVEVSSHDEAIEPTEVPVLRRSSRVRRPPPCLDDYTMA